MEGTVTMKKTIKALPQRTAVRTLAFFTALCVLAGVFAVGSGGASGGITASAASGASPAAALIARPTASTVLVNSEKVDFDAYNINDNNYFKLRDLAYILNGTVKQFSVDWDGASNTIHLKSGQPYIPVGSEMKSKGAANKTPSPTTSQVFLDGDEVFFTAYNIEDNNYFKLRDIGQAFDFGTDWDNDTQTVIIDTSKGYTPEPASAVQWKQLYLAEMQAAAAYDESLRADDDALSKHDWDGRYPFSLSGFMLADLNFDGIPELMILGDAASASTMMRIFTIINNKVELIFTGWGNTFDLYRKISDGSLAYRLKSYNGDYIGAFGSFYISDSSTLMDSYFREKAWRADFSETFDPDDPHAVPVWTFNGESVSEVEYYARIDGLLAGFQSVDYIPAELMHWDTDFNTDGMRAFLNSYIPEK